MSSQNRFSKLIFSQNLLYFFFYKFILFIYFWLHWVFFATRGISLVVVSGGYSSLQFVGFSLWWLLLLRSTGSRSVGFSSCGARAQQLWLTGSRVQAQQLWRTGLVAPQHVGSSRTRARTHVPCLGRQILNHCAIREVPNFAFSQYISTTQTLIDPLRIYKSFSLIILPNRLLKFSSLQA